MSDQEHYHSLGLTEKQHVMSMSQPKYVEFIEKYKVYRSTDQELQDAARAQDHRQAEIDRLIAEEFLTEHMAGTIMGLSAYKVRRAAEAGMIVGVRWQRTFYILIDSLREAGYHV